MQAKCGDTLLLSLSQIDREHWELIAEENEFARAVEAGASRAELEIRLTRLIQGFQSHFQSEESLMRPTGSLRWSGTPPSTGNSLGRFANFATIWNLVW